MKDLTDPTNRDSVPAMLTPGEWVINKEASQMFGPQLQAMNDAGLQQRSVENQIVTANDGKYILSEDDKDYLIRMAAAEARGESEEGQAAVMFAALNRQKANSKEFGGNKIKNIIDHPNAFSSVTDAANKHYYTDKNIINSKEYAKAKSILDSIISGGIQDPTGGAEHFLNEPVVRSSRKKGDLPGWWNNTHNRKQIGKHTFALNNRVHNLDPKQLLNMYEKSQPFLVKSIRPKSRTLDAPVSNAEDHINSILKSTQNVPAMEDIPMYANDGANSIQTLIQGLLKGSKSGGLKKHNVNQLGRDQMTDESMLYNSSQSKFNGQNVLGGPSDPYGRQLSMYPPQVNVHGFPTQGTGDVTFSIPKPEEKRDLWEFYQGTDENDATNQTLQKNINTNERNIIPSGVNTTQVVPSISEPIGIAEDTNWVRDLYKKKISAPEFLGGGDLFGFTKNLVPEVNTSEGLANAQNRFIHPLSPDYVKPEREEVGVGPMGSSVVKKIPLKTTEDYLRAEENNLAYLKNQMEMIQSGSSEGKIKNIIDLDEKIQKSMIKIETFQAKNITNAIDGRKSNNVLINKAKEERKNLIDSGRSEDDPTILKLDQYINNINSYASVPDAFSTTNKERWENSVNPPIHGSKADIKNRLENLAGQTDAPVLPGSEEERADIYGNKPFGGQAKSMLQEIKEAELKGSGKFSKMLESSKGLIKAAFDDVFDGQSLARAAMIYSAFRLTGATGNQALKAAGSDYMEQVEYVNKRDLWSNHIKKLSGYKVFTNPSLELYARTKNTEDLVRFTDLTNIISGNEQKMGYFKKANGSWSGPVATRSYTTTSDSGGSGWFHMVNGQKKPINLADGNFTFDPVKAMDINTSEWKTYNATAVEGYRNVITEEIDLPKYQIKVTTNTSAMFDKETKEESFFKTLNKQVEADALSIFATRYNLAPATVNKIYQLAMSEAYKDSKINDNKKINSVAGSNADSKYMSSAWIKVNIGDDSLFITKKGNNESEHEYDQPNNIVDTLTRFQNFSVPSSGERKYLWENKKNPENSLKDKDLPEFSSALLASLGSKSSSSNMPSWETWRKNFVTDEDSSYKDNTKIDEWRNDHPLLAGRSEFLKYLEYIMYDLTLRGS